MANVIMKKLNGPPLEISGEFFTHTVTGIEGHPYTLLAKPERNDSGKVVNLKWWNPDTQRVNSIKPKY